MSNTGRGPRKPNRNSPTLRQRRKDSKLHVPSPAMTALVIHGCDGFGARTPMLVGESDDEEYTESGVCPKCRYVECATPCVCYECHSIECATSCPRHPEHVEPVRHGTGKEFTGPIAAATLPCGASHEDMKRALEQLDATFERAKELVTPAPDKPPPPWERKESQRWEHPGGVEVLGAPGKWKWGDLITWLGEEVTSALACEAALASVPVGGERPDWKVGSCQLTYHPDGQGVGVLWEKIDGPRCDWGAAFSNGSHEDYEGFTLLEAQLAVEATARKLSND